MAKRGYVIANQDEEYLAGYCLLGGGYISRLWAVVSDLAMVFVTRAAVDRAARELDYEGRLYLLRINETATQFLVSTVDGGDVPS